MKAYSPADKSETHSEKQIWDILDITWVVRWLQCFLEFRWIDALDLNGPASFLFDNLGQLGHRVGIATDMDGVWD